MDLTASGGEEEEGCDVEIPLSSDVVNIRSWRLARANGEEGTASSGSSTTDHFEDSTQ